MTKKTQDDLADTVTEVGDVDDLAEVEGEYEDEDLADSAPPLVGQLVTLPDFGDAFAVVVGVDPVQIIDLGPAREYQLPVVPAT
jgi:hypothetical protein